MQINSDCQRCAALLCTSGSRLFAPLGWREEMIEFKDIACLSEPLKRLIEVIAEGIGGISRPILTRKNADAKAYEVRKVAEAIADSQKLLGPVSYSAGEIIIESGQGEKTPQLPEAALDRRVLSRMAYQEANRQSNLERITQYAAEDIDGKEKIGHDRPDSDWTARFFRIAEDINAEQMQALWGKVLSGEVKRPGSFSLRTLDILKNISQNEAETFVRAGKIAFLSGGKVFIPNSDRGKFLESHFGLGFLDLLILREIGLLSPSDLEFSLSATEEDQQSVFTCGSTCIFVDRPAGTPKQPVNALVFTEIGKQLLELVERVEASPEYISKFASSFQREGVVVKSGRIIKWHDKGFRHSELREVPGNKPKANKQEEKPNK